MKRADKTLRALLDEMPGTRMLPEPVRERVARDAYDTIHQRNDFVVRSGDPVHSWIGVADGLIKITNAFRSGKVVMFTGVPTGSWIGEGSIIKTELRRYDVVAMRPTRVIHIPRATFRWLLDTSFEFNHFIIDQLNERLAQYLGTVEADRLTDPVARLARAISGMFNPVLYPNMQEKLPISQEELGELAGLQRQRANTSVKRLEAMGFVRAEYGSLVVTDLMGLRNYQEREG
jgi:CRP/FNR family cyclic AMP-dependent transcriptional regulator